jgi:hypothetical protein
MPTVLSIVLSLLGLFLIRLLLGLRRAAHGVGSVLFRPRNDHLINVRVTFAAASLVHSSLLIRFLP